MAERRAEGRPTPPEETHEPGDRGDVWRPIGPRAATITRISWGAIFAGAVVALVAQLLFSLLGLAIGFSIIEPLTGQTPWEGIGIGAGIWWLVTALLSLFLGGWTAGRLAGMPLRQDALLHGIVAWGLVTFISFSLVITGVGAVIGGALNVIEQGAQIIGGGVGAVAPAQIQSEVAESIPTADAQTVQDVAVALQRLLVQGNEADRQTVINILTERSELNEAEARDLVAQFEQRYQQATQRATEVTQEVVDAMAMSAWWAFFALLLGAVAAAVGSALAAPRDLPASPGVRRE